MPDFPRLAAAIRARATALGWKQQDLIKRTTLSRENVSSLWRGDRTFAPSPATREKLERALGWAPGSVEACLEGGEPTLLPEGAKATAQDRTEGVIAERGALPLRVKLALEAGQPLDYDVLEFEVGGRQLSIIAFAQTSIFDTEQERAVLKEQLQTFHRMMDGVRREGEGAADETSD